MVMVYLRLDSESTDFVIRTYDLDGIIRAAVRPFAGEFIGGGCSCTMSRSITAP